MGILWAHTGAIGCIVLTYHLSIVEGKILVSMVANTRLHWIQVQPERVLWYKEQVLVGL